MILEKLTACVGRENIRQGELLSNYTGFRIGGPADYTVRPQTKEALRDTIALCTAEGTRWILLGRGSNLLAADEGFRGVVILPGGEFSVVTSEGDRLRAGAAVSLARLAREAAVRSLAGLEFASGIPGSLGGAVFMNAGAYGGEMAQVVESVDYLDENGEFRTLSGEDAGFGYRHSCFQEHPWVVLGAVLSLHPGSREAIEEEMLRLNRARKEKQPLEYPSAGSTFRRPEGYFAGKLIQDAGLKGFRIGGAAVSEKHAGFVINAGGATAKDVRELVTEVARRVRAESGVSLVPEVLYLGPEGPEPLIKEGEIG